MRQMHLSTLVIVKYTKEHSHKGLQEFLRLITINIETLINKIRYVI